MKWHYDKTRKVFYDPTIRVGSVVRIVSSPYSGVSNGATARVIEIRECHFRDWHGRYEPLYVVFGLRCTRYLRHEIELV